MKKPVKITIEHIGPAPSELKLTDLPEHLVSPFLMYICKATIEAFKDPEYQARYEAWYKEKYGVPYVPPERSEDHGVAIEDHPSRDCPSCGERSVMYFYKRVGRYRMECSSCFYVTSFCSSPELADWHFRNCTCLT